jgi:hypothetical protein
LLLRSDRDCEVDERGIPVAAIAHGYPKEGLDGATFEDTARWARQFVDPPSDELLLESYLYYLENDAFLPRPDAPPPLPWEETQAKRD